MTITLTKGDRFTRRVLARESVDQRFPGVLIHEGDKRNGPGRFDETCVFLTREEIAKLAKMYPIR